MNHLESQHRHSNAAHRRHLLSDAARLGSTRKAASVAALLMMGAAHAESPLCANNWCGTWTGGVYDSAYGTYTYQSANNVATDSQLVCVNSNPLKTTTALTSGTCAQPADGSTVTPVAIGTVQMSASGGIAFDNGSSSSSPIFFNGGNAGSVVAINTKQLSNTSGSLVVFLSGSGSNPQAYTYLLERAATEPGVVAAISLQYENSVFINTYCQQNPVNNPQLSLTQRIDACLTNAHGEVLYGAGTSYPLSTTSPLGTTFLISDSSQAWTSVSATNSIANRLVMTIDYLQARHPANTSSAFWAHFLAGVVSGSTSPYTTAFASNKSAYPWWPQIILAGHSQGGAQAAFAMTTLAYSAAQTAKGTGPGAGKVPHGVLMSAPDDSTTPNGYSTPSWISQSTVGSRLWGLRHGPDGGSSDSDEGPWGENVQNNWNNFGSGGGLNGGVQTIFRQACLDNMATNSNNVSGQWESPVVITCGSVLPDMTSTRQFILASSLVESGSDPEILIAPGIAAHNSSAVDSIATSISFAASQPTLGTSPSQDQQNPDASIPDPALTANARRSTFWVKNSKLPYNTGATCSILSPNVALLWDAMFSNTQ